MRGGCCNTALEHVLRQSRPERQLHIGHRLDAAEAVPCTKMCRCYCITAAEACRAWAGARVRQARSLHRA